jgi:oxaloacetate decarboxylase alpha subunit
VLAAGPARRHYNPDLAGVLGLLAALRSRPPLAQLAVGKPGFRLELRGAGPARTGGDGGR